MPSFIRRIFSLKWPLHKWEAVLLTAVMAWGLTLFSISVMGQYGLALFVLMPVSIGMGPAVLYGSRQQMGRGAAIGLGLWALLLFVSGLLVFGIEGLICLAMAAPLAIPLVILGGFIGHAIVQSGGRKDNGLVVIAGLLLAIPAMSFMEKDAGPALTAVTSAMVIEADAKTVWEHVVEFPELEEPSEFLFKTGIAYPINARIEGRGVGAVRHCNFTTGSFVEPITVWDEPRLLGFDVVEQPEPMRELSFWDIDAPHLHDYFVSTRGQFKLTELPGGRTHLEGTTWYYHRIRPAFYWRLWSDYIIHRIHHRVLTHIKAQAEAAK